jgi:hypothetical protein
MIRRTYAAGRWLSSGGQIGRPFRSRGSSVSMVMVAAVALPPCLAFEQVAQDALALPGADTHLIPDNYATRKTPAIHQWLVKHPLFHLHFTPISSSWFNLDERGFAELTTRKLRRSAYRSVTELETCIREWINEWDKNPKPFLRQLRLMV